MSREEPIRIVHSARPAGEALDDVRLQIDIRVQVEEAGAEFQNTDSARPTAADLCCLASGMYRARRNRDKMLDGELFGEPAWDMLLALYHLPQQGERLGVTALCYAANVAPTTGLRIQAVLAERGLIERQQEATDRRRQVISLSEKGRLLLENYLTSLFHKGSAARAFLGLAST